MSNLNATPGGKPYTECSPDELRTEIERLAAECKAHPFLWAKINREIAVKKGWLEHEETQA